MEGLGQLSVGCESVEVGAIWREKKSSSTERGEDAKTSFNHLLRPAENATCTTTHPGLGK